MKINFIYLLFNLFSSLLSAQHNLEGEWLFSGSKENEFDVYVLDKPVKDDVRDQNNWLSNFYPNSDKETIKVWVKFEYKKKEKVKNQYANYSVQLMEFDLPREKNRNLEIIYYSKSGDVILHSESSYYSEWQNIIPNSVGNGIFVSVKEIIEDIQAKDISVIDLINCFKAGNRKKISEKIVYPLKMPYPLPSIQNSGEFILRFDEVFDHDLINAISNSSIEDWSSYWNIYYTLFGNGEIFVNREGKIEKTNYSTNRQKDEIEAYILKDKKYLNIKVKNYSAPIVIAESEELRIRIDQLNSTNYDAKEEEDNFRLTIWNKGDKMSAEPISYFENGIANTSAHGLIMVYDENKYIFSNSKLFYDVKSEKYYNDFEIYEIDLIEESIVIKNKNIVIKSQKIEVLSADFLEKERIQIEIEAETLRKKLEEEEREIKKQAKFLELTTQGDELSFSRKYKSALKLYQEANNLYYNNEILLVKITELELKISHIDISFNFRKKLIENLKIKAEIFKDTLVSKTLFENKKSFSKSYDLCINYYKNQYDSVFLYIKPLLIKSIEQTESWNDDDQIGLEKLQKLIESLIELQTFKETIENAIIEKEKATLKLLNSSLNPEIIVKSVLEGEKPEKNN